MNEVKDFSNSLIKLENVSKFYNIGNNVIKALSNINLSVYKKDFIAIVGPSGSGKTTLLNILGCLDKPTKGKVYIENIDVVNLNDNELSILRANKIGFVFQTFNLIPTLTAKENVEIASSFSNKGFNESERALELLKLVGLEKRANHKPNQLSGGEQQRVAIARALMNDPQIILADEPTGNLDSKTAMEIIDLFYNLNKYHDKTIIIVTHNLSLTDKCNRIIYLKDGIIENEIKKSL